MNRAADEEQPQGRLGELVGAMADSFRRRPTARLLRLEERLAWLSRASTWLLLAALVYFAYQLWGELYAELGGDGSQQQLRSPGVALGSDEARSSIFYIFAVALAGPVILLVGYVAIGLFYNLSVGTLTRHIPLSRFAIVPIMLLLLLTTLQSRRDEVKDGIIDAHALVEQRIGSAKSLQLQHSAASARTLEQLRRQYDELAASEEGMSDLPEIPPGSESEQPSAEERQRQLAALLQQLGELRAAPQQSEGGR